MLATDEWLFLETDLDFSLYGEEGESYKPFIEDLLIRGFGTISYGAILTNTVSYGSSILTEADNSDNLISDFFEIIF